MASALLTTLVTQGVLHAGEKRPLAVTMRDFGVKRLGKLLEELPLLRCQLLGRDDLNSDDLVAAICSADARCPSPLHAELLSALGPVREPERHLPIDGIYVQLVSKRRLRHVDPYL